MKLSQKPLTYVLLGISTAVLAFGIVLWSTYTPTYSQQAEASIKANETFLQIEGISLRYRTAGSQKNPPVLLIHGIASSLETWKELMPRLAEKYYVVAFDLPGFGLSGRPDHFGYSRDDFARVTIALMENLKLGPTHLIGHSLGGGIALRIAAQRPDQVKSLTLIGSTGYAFTPPMALRFLAGSWDIVRPWIGEWSIANLLSSATANHSIIDKAMIHDYFVPVHLPGRFGFAPTLEAENMEQTDSERQDIRNLDVPTLVIWGEKDQWVPVKFAEQFSEDIYGADVFIEKRGGHMVHQEYPEPIHKKILGFLESAGKPQPAETDPDTDNNFDLRESTERIRELDPGVSETPAPRGK